MLLYSCPYAPLCLVSEFATLYLIVGRIVRRHSCINILIKETQLYKYPHPHLMYCWKKRKNVLPIIDSHKQFGGQTSSHVLLGKNVLLVICTVGKSPSSHKQIGSMASSHVHSQNSYIYKSCLLSNSCCWIDSISFIWTIESTIGDVFYHTKFTLFFVFLSHIKIQLTFGFYHILPGIS